MKKLLLTLVLVVVTISLSFETTLKDKRRLSHKRADFLTTYQVIKEHEGYYANHVNDRGGETYGGVSRRQHPDWYGWRYIDQYKLGHGELRHNQRLPELDFWVQDFYLDLWVSEGFNDLRDQRVATYTFDFRVNGTVGARILQQTLRDLGHDVVVNNQVDAATISAVNKCNQRKLLVHLKYRRVKFYKSIVRRDKTQRGFLKHWLQRASRV